MIIISYLAVLLGMSIDAFVIKTVWNVIAPHFHGTFLMTFEQSFTLVAIVLLLNFLRYELVTLVSCFSNNENKD